MSGRRFPLQSLLLSLGLALALVAPIGCGGSQPEVPSAWIQGEWELDLGPLVSAVQRDLRAAQAAERAADQETSGEAAENDEAAEDEGAAEDEAAADEAAADENAAEGEGTERGSSNAGSGEFSEQERQFALAMQQGFRMNLAFLEEGQFRMNGRFMEERSEQSGTWEILEEAEDGLLLQVTVDGDASRIPVYFRGRDVLLVEDDGRQLTFNRRVTEGD